MKTIVWLLVGVVWTVFVGCTATPPVQEATEDASAMVPVVAGVVAPSDVSVGLPTFEEARVVRVSDGDTVLVEFDEHDDGTIDRVKVRLIGVSTPEMGEPYSRKAQALLAELTLNRVVFMEREGPNEQPASGHYPRRLLRHLYVSDQQTGDRIHVNAALVEAGFAISDPHGNMRYKEKFDALQQGARREGRGRWHGPRKTTHRNKENERRPGEFRWAVSFFVLSTLSEIGFCGRLGELCPPKFLHRVFVRCKSIGGT